MCYFINIRMRKIEKGEMNMLNEEICKLRDKLNKSIECGESYDMKMVTIMQLHIN